MKPAVFLLIILFFATCVEPPEENIDYDFSNQGVFVVNEGNFTYGNASLSFIDFENDSIYNHVFFNATGYPLGDVAQSITLWQNLAFVVINNSGKIYVIDSRTAKYEGTIKGLTSPRYIEIISNEKAYVSDLYSNFLTIVNPFTFEVIGAINLEAPSETMQQWNNYVFVINWNQGNKLFKINSITNSIDTSIVTNYQPNSLVIDKNDKLWVLSDGGLNIDIAENDFAALTCINPSTMEIERILEFPNKTNSPSHLTINKTLDTLFFLNSSWSGGASNGGVFQMAVSSENLPQAPLVTENNRLFYSFSLINDGRIIISDAIDYSQEGDVLIYSSSGKLRKNYKVGIIPGNFRVNER